MPREYKIMGELCLGGDKGGIISLSLIDKSKLII